MSRYLRRFIVLMVIYLTSIAGFTVTASAYDTRHFYNHSSKRFSVVFDLNMFNGGATCSIGNATNQRFCVVPPGGTAELHYPNFPVSGVPGIFIHSLDTPNPDLPRNTFRHLRQLRYRTWRKHGKHRRKRPGQRRRPDLREGGISGRLRLPIGWAWDRPKKPRNILSLSA